MDSLTLHDLDDDMLARLCILATQHGRSMEDEARRILIDALCPDTASAPSPSVGGDSGASPEASGDARLKPPAFSTDT
ncbi:plasmid stabilization protein [Luteimonas sp. RC10]|uniref:FitA-like ribbon-helix-helix domain-containing protein n=1 Tax=Luteimonas sp. RC10 TaxID=2587035 RepID=UPI00160E4777|nr:plasmid stabilization protein [Luteimonas sp. RC10]MBB3342458.1 plasmid stability protein [Luteimonas sp. RC10]